VRFHRHSPQLGLEVKPDRSSSPSIGRLTCSCHDIYLVDKEKERSRSTSTSVGWCVHCKLTPGHVPSPQFRGSHAMMQRSLDCGALPSSLIHYFPQSGLLYRLWPASIVNELPPGQLVRRSLDRASPWPPSRHSVARRTLSWRSTYTIQTRYVLGSDEPRKPPVSLQRFYCSYRSSAQDTEDTGGSESAQMNERKVVVYCVETRASEEKMGLAPSMCLTRGLAPRRC
jgi:hypothetical protein